MSRFAEASERAGRAVPDNPRVDWAKEREAAECLLSDTAPEQAIPSRPTVASSARAATAASSPLPDAASPSPDAASPPPDSIGQTFAWPPQFDLDEIDLSRDANARNFRRPSARTQTLPHGRGRERDDRTPHRHSEFQQESAASSPRVSAIVMPPRENAAASKRGVYRNLVGAEASLTIPRWVVVAIGLIVLLVSAALLTYVLRHRDIAVGPPYVPPFESASRGEGEIGGMAGARSMLPPIFDIGWRYSPARSNVTP